MKSRSNTKNVLINQGLPILLTVVVFAFLALALWLQVVLLNRVTTDDIAVHIRLSDVVIGLTVYLKTAIDFAIFIGRLMDKNQGLKGRIGIEIGSALGNGLGTMAVLLVWTFFKEVNWLLAIMVFLAALVLFQLAQDSLEHARTENSKYPKWFNTFSAGFDHFLNFVNKITGPVLRRVIPSQSLKVSTKKTFIGIFVLAFTVPFILGLDDFAGYVPLFSVVNVLGFGIGVFLGHMILNIFLYISPNRTTKAVKNPVFALLGSMAFVLLAVWGFIEAFKLLFLHH